MNTPGRFETVPTTSRGAEFLARRHGFGSLNNLADSLPQEAQIIDIGAGASPLGNEVAKSRPDIRWVNFDFSYTDQNILDEISADSPENVEFTAGDATKLDQIYRPETFDAVFSYWLMPHLSLYSTVPAKEAAHGMFTIAKYGGMLSVGPKRSAAKSILRKPLTHVVTKDLDDTAADFSTDALAATRLHGPRVLAQRVINEAFSEVFDTTRYTKHSPRLGLNMILVPRTGQYHSPLHPSALPTTAKLELNIAQQLFRPANYRKVAN